MLNAHQLWSKQKDTLCFATWKNRCALARMRSNGLSNEQHSQTSTISSFRSVTMKKSAITLILFSIVYRIRSFSIPARGYYAKDTTALSMGLFDGRPGVSKLPTKANRFVSPQLVDFAPKSFFYISLTDSNILLFLGRDKQAIESIKAAINKPKTKSYPLIECEFPPLTELNKLGDGSLRSANQVNDVRHCNYLPRY